MKITTGRMDNGQIANKHQGKRLADGVLMHVVTLACKDPHHAAEFLAVLAEHARRDAMAYNCLAFEFGLKEGTDDTVYLVERWRCWEDLDAMLAERVEPVMPVYNALLKRPFDPAADSVRLVLAAR
ncbi:MAG: hypothetical protein H6844_01975 [Alphaproteobacteria bacterium]|nr:hypothetical protein [Alphaproteobacteria bacterium]